MPGCGGLSQISIFPQSHGLSVFTGLLATLVFVAFAHAQTVPLGIAPTLYTSADNIRWLDADSANVVRMFKWLEHFRAVSISH